MTGSRFFPTKTRRAYRPRSGDGLRSRPFTMSVNPETDAIIRREAGLLDMAVSAFYQRGGVLLATLTRDERETGLLPMPGRITDAEAERYEDAADAAGMSVEAWIAQVLERATADGLTTNQEARKGAAMRVG